MSWLTPWIIYMIGVALVLIALWIIAPHLPGLNQARLALGRFGDDIRDDPPPGWLWLKSELDALSDEWAPQFASSTNRNAALGALMPFLALVMPQGAAQMGAGYVVAGLTVFFMLRTFAGRKRAAGPIVTPRDMLDTRGMLPELGPNPNPPATPMPRVVMDGLTARAVPAVAYDPAKDTRVSDAADRPAPGDRPSSVIPVKRRYRPTRPAAKKATGKKKATAKRRRA